MQTRVRCQIIQPAAGRANKRSSLPTRPPDPLTIKLKSIRGSLPEKIVKAHTVKKIDTWTANETATSKIYLATHSETVQLDWFIDGGIQL